MKKTTPYGARTSSRRGRANRTVIAALLAGTTIVTAPDMTQAQSYRFNSVQVDGNARIETGTVLSYAGIARGQAISAAQLNDAYQRLVASGLFETVEITPRGGTLVITVTEYPTVNRIRFEGKSQVEGQVFEIADYDVLWDCRTGARKVKFRTPMFITEVPYQMGLKRIFQINIDILDLDGGYEEIFSTTIFFNLDKDRIVFDGVNIEKYGKIPKTKIARNKISSRTAVVSRRDLSRRPHW